MYRDHDIGDGPSPDNARGTNQDFDRYIRTFHALATRYTAECCIVQQLGVTYFI